MKHKGKTLSEHDDEWVRCENGEKMHYKYRAKPRWIPHDEELKCNKCHKHLTAANPYWMCKCLPHKHESKLAFCRDHGIKTMKQKSLILEMAEKCERGHNLEFKHHGAPPHDKDGEFLCDECGRGFPYTVAFWKCIDPEHKNIT